MFRRLQRWFLPGVEPVELDTFRTRREVLQRLNEVIAPRDMPRDARPFRGEVRHGAFRFTARQGIPGIGARQSVVTGRVVSRTPGARVQAWISPPRGTKWNSVTVLITTAVWLALTARAFLAEPHHGFFAIALIGLIPLAAVHATMWWELRRLKRALARIVEAEPDPRERLPAVQRWLDRAQLR